MEKIEILEQEIQKLKERNQKVEANKAWETSWTRKFLLMLTTYFVMVLIFTGMRNDNPWINAIIPTLGFFLSTLTLPFIRSFWEKYIYKR